VALSERFVAYTPYASRSPFEMTIAPIAHAHDFAAAPDEDIVALGEICRDVLARLKVTLKDLPYNFVLHSAPNVDSEPVAAGHLDTLERDFHWHLEIVPRVRQLAGFEVGTGFYVNSMLPEDAARFLREAL